MHCKHFGVCGGCTLPGVPYDEQLAKKRKDLSRLLRMDVPPLVPSPSESGFRSKVSFVFANAVMGHYALKSQRVIPIDECPVHHERGNRIAFAVESVLLASRSGGPARSGRCFDTSSSGRLKTAGSDGDVVVARHDKALAGPVRKFWPADRPDGSPNIQTGRAVHGATRRSRLKAAATSRKWSRDVYLVRRRRFPDECWRPRTREKVLKRSTT